MRILLDENFPIQLYRRLQERGHAATVMISRVPQAIRVEAWRIHDL